MRVADFKKSLVLGLALLLSSEAVLAKKMYRWVDENGNVYFFRSGAARSSEAPARNAERKSQGT